MRIIESIWISREFTDTIGVTFIHLGYITFIDMLSDKEVQSMVEGALDIFADSNMDEFDFTNVGGNDGIIEFGITDGSKFKMTLTRL